MSVEASTTSASTATPTKGPRLYHSGQAGLHKEDVLNLTIPAPEHKITDIRVFRTPNVSEWMPDLQQYQNKFFRTRLGQQGLRGFRQKITRDQLILVDLVRKSGDVKALAFPRAGPRDYVVFKPQEVKAAIVTCGGLCPGLNDVVVELVQMLYYNYSVDTVYGIRSGFRGFYEKKYMPYWVLTPENTKDVQKRGGTFLGSSRGGFDKDKIIDACIDHGINQIYIIGGDGTHRGADILFRESRRRKLKMTVVGIPKVSFSQF
jgi:6-phosphofructokinase 1